MISVNSGRSSGLADWDNANGEELKRNKTDTKITQALLILISGAFFRLRNLEKNQIFEVKHSTDHFDFDSGVRSRLGDR